jgi:formate dehydrogenase major subunit
MYLIQKFARAAVGTNNVGSFHYLNRGNGYQFDSCANAPFEHIIKSSKVILFGSEINKENAVAGFMINNYCFRNNIPLEVITTDDSNSMNHKADSHLKIKSYYHFVRAVNHYLISKGLENKLFLKDQCKGFDDYKRQLIGEDYSKLVKESGVCCEECLVKFAEDYNKEINALLVFSEKHVSSNTAKELFNLAMITGKLGKTANGLIALKEKNNAQGLSDMGMFPDLLPGGKPNVNESIEKLKKVWGVNNLSNRVNENLFDLLGARDVKNIFVFGEDPVGCTMDPKSITTLLSNANFVVVQDYFITDTAEHADLIFPASYPIEIGGSFANTQKFIQAFTAVKKCGAAKTSYELLSDLLNKFGVKAKYDSADDVMKEMAVFFEQDKMSEKKYMFSITAGDNANRLFNFGCDVLTKRFEEESEKAFKELKECCCDATCA